MALEKRLVILGRVQREGKDLDALLQDRGFQVYTIQSEDEVLDVVRFSQPDIVMVAGSPHLPFLARLVSTSQSSGQNLVAVVWLGLSASAAVDMLDMGVDYVSASYQPDWLAAQLRACLRRFGRERSAPSLIDLGHLCIDLQQRQVIVNGREVALTPTEFAVLRVLAERPGTVLPSGEIMQQVMGIRIAESEAQDLLKVHIHRLRHKLQADDEERRFIRTVRGHGYMYAFERRSKDREDGQESLVDSTRASSTEAQDRLL